MKAIFLAAATAMAVFAASASAAPAATSTKSCEQERYVKPESPYVYSINIHALRTKIFQLRSIGGNFRIYVIDEKYKTVAAGAPDGTWETLEWTPGKTGRYKVVIWNVDKQSGGKFTLCWA